MTFQGVAENFFHEYAINHVQKSPVFCKAWTHDKARNAGLFEV